MASIMTAGPPSLAASALERLPTELASAISTFLPNRDIKNLRLVSRSTRDRYPLRLRRLFLSANPRNIDVFRAVALHDVFRKSVVEIVWDDARLASGPPEYSGDDHKDGGNLWDSDPEDSDDNDLQEDSPPSWFTKACRDNNEKLKCRIGNDVLRPDQLARIRQVKQQMPLNLAWTYYQQLLQQQEELLLSEADIEVFRYGLGRFPSLEKLTITPAAHALLYEPLYETPIIRSFPYGFNYPIPYTWPINPSGEVYKLPPWDGNDVKGKTPWRGFNYVIHELAGARQHVSELVIEVNTLRTGLNCRVFDKPPCQQYNELAALLRRPVFCRLDLALHADGEYYRNWPCLRNALLRDALAEATDLQHVRFGAYHDLCQYEECSEPGDPTAARVFTPLRSILPVDRWPKLRHLGLCDLLVRQDDLLSVLAELSPTLESIELIFLYFLDGGTHGGLLDDMRSTLGWCNQAAANRSSNNSRPPPKVNINLRIRGTDTLRFCNADNEVHEFLYGDGENPFLWEGHHINVLLPGTGVVCDPFDPTYKWPDAVDAVLMRLGIIKWNEDVVKDHEAFEKRQRERREQQQTGAS